ADETPIQIRPSTPMCTERTGGYSAAVVGLFNAPGGIGNRAWCRSPSISRVRVVAIGGCLLACSARGDTAGVWRCAVVIWRYIRICGRLPPLPRLAGEMPNILILYATTDGHTAKVARVLGESLTAAGHSVTVHDARDPGDAPAADGFDGVVVAASIHVSG